MPGCINSVPEGVPMTYLKSNYLISLRKSRMRKERFGQSGRYHAARLIGGFYYSYMHPEEVGDRTKGWLVMAHD